MGIPSPGGNSNWSSRSVRDILKNPLHAGLVRVKGKCVRGAHFGDRIIDESLFQAAEERLRGEEDRNRNS